jgi:hypothetical protein
VADREESSFFHVLSLTLLTLSHFHSSLSYCLIALLTSPDLKSRASFPASSASSAIFAIQPRNKRSSLSVGSSSRRYIFSSPHHASYIASLRRILAPGVSPEVISHTPLLRSPSVSSSSSHRIASGSIIASNPSHWVGSSRRYILFI